MNRVINWFVHNPVAANLLMVLIIVGGFMTLPKVKQEIFPEFSTERITVTVDYLGAAPEEVEEGVCMRIEEAVEGIDGIKKTTSSANEGRGMVTIEAMPKADVRQLLDDVKVRVDAIDTFPEETEKPIVQELVVRYQVINVAVSGDIDERSLKTVGERVRDEISALPDITQVELVVARPYEVSIEVSEFALRRWGISFDTVVEAVRRSSLDLPGGSIKTDGGEILLRTKGQAYRGPEFEDLVLLTRRDGTRLVLSDVATVVDGFQETDLMARFNGEPTVIVQVFRVGDQSALKLASAVRNYVETAASRLSEGITLTTWQDGSVYLRSRIDLLSKNAAQGFVLVLIVLALFLKFRLAVWVCIGIPIAFLGTFWVLPTLDVSINMLSLFALIVVLGIVVDDAIIVGESIYTLQERGMKPLDAAVDGTRRVATPVIFAVLTSIAAFVPLTAVSGNLGKVMRVVPLVVIPTLVFSLIESLMVLPSHLSHRPPRRFLQVIFSPLDRVQSAVTAGLQWFIEKIYRPVLDFALEHRYLTSSVGVTTLLLTLGLVLGGWVRFVFLPPVEDDNVAAALTMPPGTPKEVTAAAVRRIEDSARKLQVELDREEKRDHSVFRHMLAVVGDQPYRTIRSRNAGGKGESFNGAHLGEVHIELAPSEKRTVSSPDIARRWRELNGAIPDAVELQYSSSIFTAGSDIEVQLSGLDNEELQYIAREAKELLASYPGVFDITDSFREGKKEIKLGILPAAEALGLSLSDLARQVRQAFYGEEAQRIQRGRDDIKVMVRYPESSRRSVGDLENMRVRTRDGTEIPFSAVATADYGRGYADIQRVDRQRTITVSAEVDEKVAEPNRILVDFTRDLDRMLIAHPRVSYSFEGEERERRDSLLDLRYGFGLAVVVMFGLLAIVFKSYAQPLIVLLAIPFGLVGAVWGHMIMGEVITILSLFGLVALTGIVVNDSLVLVDYINGRRAKGHEVREAVQLAGAARFRAILLTSLTTFAGLTPLLLEQSVQAKFLIPMAISIAFGVLFSTFITLVLVPSSYLILEDIKSNSRRFFSWLFPADGSEEDGVSSPPPPDSPADRSFQPQ